MRTRLSIEPISLYFFNCVMLDHLMRDVVTVRVAPMRPRRVLTMARIMRRIVSHAFIVSLNLRKKNSIPDF